MELKDRKFINNTGTLPGFNGGLAPVTTAGMKPGTAYALTNTNRLNSTIAGNLAQINSSQAQNKPLIKNAPTTGSLTGGNTGPSLADSSAAGIHWGFALGSWLGGGVLEGLGQIKSADEHLAEAGTSTANINGISYTQLNSVDANKIMSNYRKSTAADWLTNPARAITKLFGSSKAEQEAENAAIYANSLLIASRDNAYTQFLRLDDAKRNGISEMQQLYAANGKLPGYVGGKPTYTVAGPTTAKPNAKLSGGEIVYNHNGLASEVGGPVNNSDQQYGYLRASDGVLSNKPGIFGYSPADMFRATGDINASEDYMIASNMAKGVRMYNCGKMPKHAEGWVGNFIPSALGTLASLDLMYNAYMNKPYKPNTYAVNPYEGEALSTLAGLRINPYPVMLQLRNAEARTNRAISSAGGLSGAQRTSARLAGLYGTLSNIANMLSNIQAQNNAYKSKYADAAINAGQASRAARMSANQWDLDMYSRAHAARNKGMQTGIANMLALIQQYQANEFKRRQFNDTMDLYRADQKQRNELNQWIRNYYASQSNPTNNQYTKGIGMSPASNDPTKNWWEMGSDLQRILAMQKYLHY